MKASRHGVRVYCAASGMLLSACTGCHSDTAQDAATSVTAIAAPVAGAPEQTADPANYNHAMSPQQQAIIQRHKDAQ